MLDADTVVRIPASDADPRVSVSMKDRGCEFVLFLPDSSGEGDLLELRVLPDTEKLEPRILRQFVPQAPLYLDYARAVMQLRDGDVREALQALRHVGATRRGLGEDFYRLVAQEYRALVDEGERYPVKALSELHHVVISTASRWIKEARRRGYVKGGSNDA